MAKKSNDYLDAKLDSIIEDVKELKTIIEVLKEDMAERRARLKVLYWVAMIAGSVLGALSHFFMRFFGR